MFVITRPGPRRRCWRALRLCSLTMSLFIGDFGYGRAHQSLSLSDVEVQLYALAEKGQYDKAAGLIRQENYLARAHQQFGDMGEGYAKALGIAGEIQRNLLVLDDAEGLLRNAL